MSTRVERVSEEVRAALASALLSETHDPRLALVSITAVDLTRDLSYGRVYWNRVSEETDARAIASTERALEKAKGFLRSYVGRQVRLRVVPELEFRYDESIERGRRMDNLLANLDIPDTDDGADD